LRVGKSLSGDGEKQQRERQASNPILHGASRLKTLVQSRCILLAKENKPADGKDKPGRDK